MFQTLKIFFQALKLITYKTEAQFTDLQPRVIVEYEIALKLMKDPICSTAVIGVVENSFHIHETQMLFSYLMPSVGIPTVQMPTIAQTQLMLRALYHIHEAKEVHGDARYVNCVLHDENYKWIDFCDKFRFSSHAVKEDVKAFLDSIQHPINKKLLDQYYCKLNSPKNALKELIMNQVIKQLVGTTNTIS